MVTLPDESFMAWGWRVPFVLSAGLVFLGLWIRNGLDETPEFKQAKESGNVAKMPLVETLQNHWREVLIAAGLKVVETAPFYIFSTFVVSYAVSTLGFDKSAALNAVMIGALVASVLIPTMGLVSDYVGRKTVYVVGCVLLGLFIIPYFMLLDTKTVWGLTLATVISFGVLWSPITAVLGTLSSEIFATKVRYTGITLGYQLGAALAGGTAPLIATWLLAKYEGSWHAVAAYLLVTVLISLIAIIAISRSRSRQ
jgi:MFS family permease